MVCTVLIISDAIEAICDIWILGDEVFREIFTTFSDLRDKPRSSRSRSNEEKSVNKEEIPYIYDTYNVNSIWPNPLSPIKSVLARILNCFITAMNENRSRQLPRVIIVIPDCDIVKNIHHYNFGVSYILGRAIRWITSQMERLIKAKKEAMKKRRAGSICASDPKIIWVKMFERPIRAEYMAIRSKFNALLEESLCSRIQSYIMSPEVSAYDFDRFGNFTEKGKVKFWKGIDRQLREFDAGSDKFDPKPVIFEN